MQGLLLSFHVKRGLKGFPNLIRNELTNQMRRCYKYVEMAKHRIQAGGYQSKQGSGNACLRYHFQKISDRLCSLQWDKPA